MKEMNETKLHRAAELAAYKLGVLKSDLSREDEEKYIRLAAEFDNYRKRSSKQFAQVIKNANEELILEVLDVVDDFNRAFETLSSSKADGSSGDRDTLLAGMKLIYDKLLSILNNRGVRIIEALGKPFDPYYHEAVMQSPSDEYDEGSVINVVSPGYMLDDKVIRHAKVVVASST
jgi:molecular chaperone GrpE